MQKVCDAGMTELSETNLHQSFFFFVNEKDLGFDQVFFFLEFCVICIRCWILTCKNVATFFFCNLLRRALCVRVERDQK